MEQLRAHNAQTVTFPADMPEPPHLRASTLSDDCAVPMAANLGGVWESLVNNGYALTDEKSIGLPQKFRENFGQTYFNDQVLRHDPGDWPVDRKRARDVIKYRWRHDQLEFEEFDTITITDRAGIPGKREHARVRLLTDPQATELVRTLLQLVPPRRRRTDGTFGVNLFRTYTNVVTKPHHDKEEFIITYVLNRVGDGAESYLYDPDVILDGGEVIDDPIMRRQLNPGDLMIFEDSKFKHGATPLVPPSGETAMRDALICTVDFEDTYLAKLR